MNGWLNFWNKPHALYVNARHLDIHYRELALRIGPLIPSADAIVLDFGSGDALHSDMIAALTGRLMLCEAADTKRAELARRFVANPKISVFAPHEAEVLPAASVDLILLISVTQYLAEAELDRLLALFRRLLKPDGRLIIADVIPPHVSAYRDALALLRFGARHGFFGAALIGLARTALSDYSRLRAEFGLTLYRQEEMLGKLIAGGFSPRRAPENLGHNQARMTFIARKT